MSKKPVISANLEGKVILITGASHGLGAYYAEMLARNNATVIVSGRSIEKIVPVVEKIRKNGNNASPLVLDMANFNSFNEKIQQILEQFKHLDVLVNNAAVSHDKSFFNITEEDWDMHMNTNTKGLFLLSQAVAEQMKKQNNGGNIINIAAINGEKIRKNCIAFGTSKAAVIHLTKAMAYELIEYNIRVNAISLGLFPSETVKEWIDSDPNAKNYLDRIPVKRAGKFSDLDGPLLLLASDASSYMYGSVLKVDGGFSIDVFMNIDI